MREVYAEQQPLIEDIIGAVQGTPAQQAAMRGGTYSSLPLAPQAQITMWTHARELARQGDARDLCAAAEDVLRSVVPVPVDWARAPNARAEAVRDAAVYLIELAELSLKYVAGSDHHYGGALISPGYAHCRPPPVCDVRPGDVVEVLMAPRTDDPAQDLCREADWAWVEIAAAHDDRLAGYVSGSTPPGECRHPIRHADRHGWAVGDPIMVPRSAIHRVAPRVLSLAARRGTAA